MRALPIAVLAVALGATRGADAPVVLTPDDRTPPALEGIDLPADLLALAITSDGRRTAWAVPLLVPKREMRSAVHVHAAGLADPVDFTLTGVVRDLLLDADGRTLYALHHRAAAKSTGETFLEVVDLPTRKARLRLHVPVTAQALESWPERGAILVASRDDLRTLFLPELRSGPLFRVPGENLALALMDGNRAVVGQADALLLLDLDDRPDHDQMPVRARVDSPGPIVSLAVTPAGSGGLARLADGRVLRFGVDPLELREAASGWVARVARQAALEPVRPSAPEQAPEPGPELRAEDPLVAAAPPVAPAPPPVPVPVPVPAVLEPPPAGARATGGTIEGEFRAVVAVVFLGPNSLVREASRVTPDAAGGFDLPPLPPGRYRVQLDGGGARVLTCEPPFAILELGTGVTPQVLHFHVLNAW